MKKYLLPLVCILLAGCGREDQHHREVMNKLDALKADLVAAGTLYTNGPPARWAYANKGEINTVIFQWTQAKIDEARRAEKLTPDVEAKISQYETLANQLMRMRISMPFPRPMYPGRPAEPAPDTKDYDELAKKVAEAKEPVAAIIDRRGREEAQLRDKYSVERVVAEYVKDRYDVVVDASMNQKVLYRSAGEVPDITEGVIRFFRERQK